MKTKFMTSRELQKELHISERTVVNYHAGYYFNRHGVQTWYYADRRRLQPVKKRGKRFYYSLNEVMRYKEMSVFDRVKSR